MVNTLRDKRLRAEIVLREPACFIPAKEEWVWMVSSKRANEVFLLWLSLCV